MRYDREKIFDLRRQGKSYREIQRIIPISRDTLSRWFKNAEWSRHTTTINRAKHLPFSIEHVKKLNEARRIRLEKIYLDAENEAETEFEIYKNDPLFMAGLMVYAGEGDKRNANLLKVSNSEPYLHLVFISFSEKFFKIPRSKVKAWLLLYPDNNIEECLHFWSQNLRINKENFTKSQVILGRLKSRKLQYGVGNSIISNTVLKKKMLKWLKLCQTHFE